MKEDVSNHLQQHQPSSANAHTLRLHQRCISILILQLFLDCEHLAVGDREDLRLSIFLAYWRVVQLSSEEKIQSYSRWVLHCLEELRHHVDDRDLTMPDDRDLTMPFPYLVIPSGGVIVISSVLLMN